MTGASLRTYTRHVLGVTLVAALAVAGLSCRVGETAPDPPSIAGCQVLPRDNPWNLDISAHPVHPNSDAFIASVEPDKHVHPDFGTVWQGAPIGIPYCIVGKDQPKVAVLFQYADESDAGPYPIPDDAPIEGGPGSEGDRHIIAIDKDNCTLYEIYAAYPVGKSERERFVVLRCAGQVAAESLPAVAQAIESRLKACGVEEPVVQAQSPDVIIAALPEGEERARALSALLQSEPLPVALEETDIEVRWRAGSGAIFDLTSNELRPRGWTSADAAGLPILPGLVRYEEFLDGEINHAIRFTVRRTQRGYILPATHFASRHDDPNLPPMGLRVRLKGDYDISGFPPQAQVVLKALKKYGMILADNGGDWFISGAPDGRWDMEQLATIKRVTGKDLEVVDTGPIVH